MQFFPRAYYLLGWNNEQFAVYYGAEYDAGYITYCDKSTSSSTLNLPPRTVLMWNAEYNTYGNGSNINLTYKYDQDGTWKKYYNINDHLGNVRTVLRKEINPPATIVKQFDYAPFGAVIPLLGNVNRIKFIGKEKDKESNYADHGVRKYDDEIGRFTSIDPLWEKYYSLTPYQYAGNNPVIAKDANGKDYDVSIEGKNIIISATYYANESNIGSLQGDLDYYNNMTGLKYTQNGTEYNVVFKLVAMLAQVPYSKLNQDVSNFDNNGNMKEPLTNSNTYETTTSLDNTNAAGTTSKNIIKILDIYSNHETVGKHEIAHSLGIPHSLTGLMTESINDSKHSQTLWPAQIYQIITNAINGVIPPTNSGLGKGTFKNR